jgi:hypothetical protein
MEQIEVLKKKDLNQTAIRNVVKTGDPHVLMDQAKNPVSQEESNTSSSQYKINKSTLGVLQKLTSVQEGHTRYVKQLSELPSLSQKSTSKKSEPQHITLQTEELKNKI